MKVKRNCTNRVSGMMMQILHHLHSMFHFYKPRVKVDALACFKSVWVFIALVGAAAALVIKIMIVVHVHSSNIFLLVIYV